MGQRSWFLFQKFREGDLVTVHMGNVIPLDGVVASGDAMVNQASMTGGISACQEGGGLLRVCGNSRRGGRDYPAGEDGCGRHQVERIVTMIEESEQLKSTAEGKAATLADALVPWSLGGTILTWLLTRNVTKALSILMVDFPAR